MIYMKSIAAHLTAIIIITIILLTVYASVQQCYRTSANDPQIQIARDISNSLSKAKLNRSYNACRYN